MAAHSMTYRCTLWLRWTLILCLLTLLLTPSSLESSKTRVAATTTNHVTTTAATTTTPVTTQGPTTSSEPRLVHTVSTRPMSWLAVGIAGTLVVTGTGLSVGDRVSIGCDLVEPLCAPTVVSDVVLSIDANGTRFATAYASISPIRSGTGQPCYQFLSVNTTYTMNLVNTATTSTLIVHPKPDVHATSSPIVRGNTSYRSFRLNGQTLMLAFKLRFLRQGVPNGCASNENDARLHRATRAEVQFTESTLPNSWEHQGKTVPSDVLTSRTLLQPIDFLPLDGLTPVLLCVQFLGMPWRLATNMTLLPPKVDWIDPINVPIMTDLTLRIGGLGLSVFDSFSIGANGDCAITLWQTWGDAMPTVQSQGRDGNAITNMSVPLRIDGDTEGTHICYRHSGSSQWTMVANVTLQRRVRSVVPTTGPTSGGALITVDGAFGASPSLISIAIGATACQILSISTDSSSVTCRLGPGVGTGHRVSAKVLSVPMVTADAFAYTPPRIEMLRPSRAADGMRVSVVGANFSPSPDMGDVTVGWLRIGGHDSHNGYTNASVVLPATWLSKEAVVFVAPIARPGETFNVAVSIGGQWSLVSDSVFTYARASHPITLLFEKQPKESFRNDLAKELAVGDAQIHFIDRQQHTSTIDPRNLVPSRARGALRLGVISLTFRVVTTVDREDDDMSWVEFEIVKLAVDGTLHKMGVSAYIPYGESNPIQVKLAPRSTGWQWHSKLTFAIAVVAVSLCGCIIGICRWRKGRHRRRRARLHWSKHTRINGSAAADHNHRIGGGDHNHRIGGGDDNHRIGGGEIGIDGFRAHDVSAAGGGGGWDKPSVVPRWMDIDPDIQDTIDGHTDKRARGLHASSIHEDVEDVEISGL